MGLGLGLAILAAIRDLRAIKVGDEDDERDVADIDRDVAQFYCRSHKAHALWSNIAIWAVLSYRGAL
jgi:hypothetical protein